VLAVVRDADAAQTRRLADAVRARLRSGLVALAGLENGTVSLVVTASPDVVATGIDCGRLLRTAAPLVGGRGGGRPDHAQGGGKDAGGAEAALAAIRSALAE
ncbi:MAG: DHHA1 domain-containing protein, partial [Vulcanimicrobiaceae bacterium]